MAQQVVLAAGDLQQQQRPGVAPKSVPAVVSEDTLAVTLPGALSPVEKALAQRSPAGAAQVREYHGQLSDDDEAIACQQEMKARVAESGAMLVLAEAAIPVAIALAFRAGRFHAQRPPARRTELSEENARPASRIVRAKCTP